MAHGTALLFDLVARDGASPVFLKVAGAADKSATAVLRSTKSLDTASARMSRTGATLTKSLTLPLVGAAAVSVAQASKYQKSMNTIAVATDQSSKQMNRLSDGLLTVAKSTGTSLGQATEALYTTEKAGLRGSKALEATRAGMEGAKAEGADLGTTMSALTSIMTSYGAKMRNPVKAMNLLIAGAGGAKTTLADFASSLSNVVPLASSLGIGFDQVAGAIDTMTKHGDTAQRATDDLNNLIRSLGGSSQVATSTMAQLGINTLDLSKTLASPNGLSNALAVIHRAIAAHTRDGMVMMSTQKASALASRSLSQELGTFSGKLSTQAKGLLSGAVGIKDFNTYAKSLGGTAGASALQFLALYKNTKGFSDQLRSGRSTTMSVVQALKAVTGGATGYNTALMLGLGTSKESQNSATLFGQSIRDVAKAAKSSGADVLGWGKTTSTFAFKIDAAKVALQTMAVELGTALIPAISKLADEGASAAHWVDGLSGSQKKLLVFSAGALAALGPLLSIGGRLATVGSGLTRFTTGVGNTLGRFNTNLGNRAGLIAMNMGKVNAAIGGAGIGLAVGELTKNSSAAVKAVGVLGSAAAGAAVGFGAGGGLGAVIGGVAGGLSALATQFFGAGKSAHAAIKPTDDYTAALQRDGDQIGKNTALLAANSLQKSGAYDLALKLGISQRTLTKATLGDSNARALVTAAETKANLAYIGAGRKVTKQQQEQEDAATQLAAKTGFLTGTINASLHAAKNIDKGLGSYKGTTTQAAAATAALSKNLTGGITDFDKAAYTVAAHTKYIASDLRGLAATKINPTIALDPAKAHSVIALLTGEIDGIKQSKNPKLNADSSLGRAAVSNLQAQINALRGRNVPVGVNDQASGALGAIQARLDALQSNKTITVTTRQVIAQSITHPAHAAAVGRGGRAAGPGYATGGIISGPGTGTSDTAGVFALSNGEAVIPAKAVSANRALVTGLIYAGRRMASGGIVHKGKDWIYGGTRYASERAAENAKTRAAKTSSSTLQSTLSSNVSSALGAVGQSYSAPFSVADVGISRVFATLRTAQTTLAKAIADGLSSKTSAKFREQIANLTKIANQQLGQLRVKIRTSDVAALRSALKGTVDDTRTALSQLYGDLSKSGSPNLAAAQALGGQLIGKQNLLAGQQNRLSTMNDYRSGVASTLAGFDPSTYGSILDLRAGIQGATGTNKLYTGQLNKLRAGAKGNGNLLALVNDLAAKGETTTLATLAGASKSDLASVGSDYGAYRSSVYVGSQAATAAKFGSTTTQVSADVKALTQSVGTLVQAVAVIARETTKPAVVGSADFRKAIDPELARLLQQLETATRHGSR